MLHAMTSNIQSIKLTAPSRLHFGLLPPGSDQRSRRGGLGVMIQEPCLLLHGVPSKKWTVTGPFQQLIDRIAAQLLGKKERDALALHIHVDQAPSAHVGYGTGTQVAMATAALLEAWIGGVNSHGEAPPNVLDRGSRSLVGSVGFAQGGLIYDSGIEKFMSPATECQAEVAGVRCYAIPVAWRWLTISADGLKGLSGESEATAFASVIADEDSRHRVMRFVENELLRRLIDNDFDGFSACLYEYGIRCGELFRQHQSGIFSSKRMSEVVTKIRGSGVCGVGQSSWGPTVFALFPDCNSAEKFATENDWLSQEGLVPMISSTELDGHKMAIDHINC